MGRIFELAGERFTMLDWDELTMQEQIDVQTMTGKTGVELVNAIAGLDIAVTAAVITVSLRRSRESGEASFDEVTAYKQSDLALIAEGDADPPTQNGQSGSVSTSDGTSKSSAEDAPPVVAAQS